MDLKNIFGMREEQDRRDDETRGSSLREAFILLEDSRGSIKRILRLSPEVAEFFHNIDQKFSFTLANTWKVWAAENGIDPNSLDAAQMDSFRDAIGSRVHTLLKSNPEYDKQLKSAKSTADVQKVIDSYTTKHAKVGESKDIYSKDVLDQLDALCRDANQKKAVRTVYLTWLRGEHAPDARGQERKWPEDKIKNLMRNVDPKIIREFYDEVAGPTTQMMSDDPENIPKVEGVKNMSQLFSIICDWRATKTAVGGDLLNFEDGWKWQALKPEENKLEAAMMHHCGTDHRGQLVSLRTQDGSPRVTMTFEPKSNKVYQIKGAYNTLPDKKFWPYIEDFWKKFKPEFRDGGLEQLRGEAGELAERLRNLSPKSKVGAMLEDISGGMTMTQKKWVWDPSSFANGAYGKIDEEDAAQIGIYLKSIGFESVEVKFSAYFKTTLYFDPQHWTKGPVEVVPPLDQAKSWNGLKIVHMARLGYTNPEITPDPIGWVEKNAKELQKFYRDVNKALLQAGGKELKALNAISIKYLNSKDLRGNPATQEDYISWFPELFSKETERWDDPKKFFAEHPEIVSGIDRYVSKFNNFGGVKENYAKILSSVTAVKKDHEGRFFVQTKDAEGKEIWLLIVPVQLTGETEPMFVFKFGRNAVYGSIPS